MKTQPTYRRFGRLFIVQHIILFTSVLLLIVSGVPVKYPDQAWARWAIWLQGGMTVRGWIHYTAGMALVGLGVFHVVWYTLVDRRIPWYRRKILPGPQDFRDGWHHLNYLVGKREALPPMDRYTWFEKLDYFGLAWGFIVMGVSGVAMLFLDTALNFIPLAWLQVLWAAHSEEAMLATLFLLIIHMYHVHFSPERFPMSLTWLHGKISHEEMEKYHPLELAQWEADDAIQDHMVLEEPSNPEAAQPPSPKRKSAPQEVTP